MSSKRIKDRTEHALTSVWAAFASADVASEAMRRRVGFPEHDERTQMRRAASAWWGRVRPVA